MPRELSRVERWEQTSEVPLLLFAAAFLVAYAWPILDPNLHPDLETFFFYASWTVWLAFTIDFLIRLWLADRRGSYALRHWYDVVLIAAPVFRPLRLLRLLAFARILNRSAVGGLTDESRSTSRARPSSPSPSAPLPSATPSGTHPGRTSRRPGMLSGGLPPRSLRSATVTAPPVTTQGRFIAVALMLVGISLVGSLTAVIAGWMIKHVETPKT